MGAKARAVREALMMAMQNLSLALMKLVPGFFMAKRQTWLTVTTKHVWQGSA